MSYYIPGQAQRGKRRGRDLSAIESPNKTSKHEGGPGSKADKEADDETNEQNIWKLFVHRYIELTDFWTQSRCDFEQMLDLSWGKYPRGS